MIICDSRAEALRRLKPTPQIRDRTSDPAGHQSPKRRPCCVIREGSMDDPYLQPGAQVIPLLHVRCGPSAYEQRDFSFRTAFRIGRTEECEVCIQEEHVSRCHAEVKFEDGLWCVRDLNSSNGIYVGDQRV